METPHNRTTPLRTAGIAGAMAVAGTTLALAAAGTVLATLALRSRLSRSRPLRGRRVVVIAGGSTGLGRALAERYARSGALLVLAARRRNHLEEARDALLTKGLLANAGDILLHSCDVSRADDAAALIEHAIARFGRIDVLINCAGTIQVGPVEDLDLDIFRTAMETNFFGAVHTIHAALPHFLAAGSGKIVNIASIGGKFAMPHLLPYVASKFALVGYSEGLHSELQSKGIHVLTVCPGLMRTGGHRHAHFHGKERAESRWFTISATTPVIAASVHRAAERIFAAETANRAEITITPQAWAAARAVGLMPEITQRVASLVNDYILPAPTGSVHPIRSGGDLAASSSGNQ